MYKLKQEYLMFASCDNTDEDIYEHFKSISEDYFNVSTNSAMADIKIEIQTNDNGCGYAYIEGTYATFCQSNSDSCMLEFKVYEDMN